MHNLHFNDLLILAKHNGTEYKSGSILQMNICGSVGPSKCGTSNGAEPSVCRETTIVGQQNGQITFNEAGGLSLTYTADQSGKDAVFGLRSHEILMFCLQKIQTML